MTPSSCCVSVPSGRCRSWCTPYAALRPIPPSPRPPMLKPVDKWAAREADRYTGCHGRPNTRVEWRTDQDEDERRRQTKSGFSLPAD